MALFDTQLAVMANQASNALISRKDPPRQGNTHPNIVPYQPFDAADQPIIIAVGNDRQFTRLAEICGQAGWASDPRFATNEMRVANRAEIVDLIAAVIVTRRASEWLEQLEAAGIPAGSINRLSQALADVQIQHRQMVRAIAGIPMVGSPVRLDGDRADADLPPPALGHHTAEVIAALGLGSGETERLKAAKIIG